MSLTRSKLPSTRGRSSVGSPFTPRQNLSQSSFLNDSFSRSQARSQMTSQLLEETQDHRVETFGKPVPVQINEALASRNRGQSAGVKVDSSGWAWLVTGRKLFIWRYSPEASTKGMYCKELNLPATELCHSADLVGVLSSTSGDTGNVGSLSVMAVTPEGVVRYWPSLANDSIVLEMDMDLAGIECHSITAFEPFGFVLATTTNELLLLAGSQKAISCQALQASAGMLSSLGRRMSSFIFGSQPASAQLWQKVLASNFTTDNSRSLYVLSGNQMFKWEVHQTTSNNVQEKLVFETDLERMFMEASTQSLQLSLDSAVQLDVWCLDMCNHGSSAVLVLAAVVLQGPSHKQLFYMLGQLSAGEQAPTKLDSINVLQFSQPYDESRRQEQLDLKLILPETSPAAFVYNPNSIICVPVCRTDETLNKIDFQTTANSLLGAGCYGDKALFFSRKYGIVHVSVSDAHPGDVLDGSRGQALETTPGDNSIAQTSMLEEGDPLTQFKAAFLQFCRGNTADAQATCDVVFAAEESGLDRAVSVLSQELIDDYPASDPRWAESIPAAGVSTTSSLIILHQLDDKAKAHDFFVEFLKGLGLWDKLGTVTVRGQPLTTCCLICEHAEKLAAATALCRIAKTYQDTVDAGIKSVITKRNVKSQYKSLTEQDLFFREVSQIGDIFESLIEYEENNSTPAVVQEVNAVLQEMLREAWNFRQAHASTYEPSPGQLQRLQGTEFLPWTATVGPSGVRTLILKQINLTVEQGIPETEDPQDRAVIFQHVVSLVDILLDGYVQQILSLRGCPEKEEWLNEVQHKYEHDRRTVIHPLLDLDQQSLVVSLAEKYHEFGALVQLCDAAGDQARLQHYADQFSQQGFSDFLFKWYMDKGERQKLLSQPAPQNENLSRFLSSHHHLSWLHDIHTADFYKAHETLAGLADNEESSLARKKTLLSLSKLALLASEEGRSETREDRLEDINNQHSVILYQETLPPDVLQRANLDLETMVPMTPSQLIELCVGDKNPESNEYDFKKALDLVHMAGLSGRGDVDLEALKQYIWSRALLKDDWSALPTSDPTASARNTVFFRTVELAYNQGVELSTFMPPLDSLLEDDDLRKAGFLDNPQFRFLLQAGYEQIGRTAQT